MGTTEGALVDFCEIFLRFVCKFVMQGSCDCDLEFISCCCKIRQDASGMVCLVGDGDGKIYPLDWGRGWGTGQICCAGDENVLLIPVGDVPVAILPIAKRYPSA